MNITSKLIRDLNNCGLSKEDKENLMSIIQFVVDLKKNEAVIIFPDERFDGTPDDIAPLNELMNKMWDIGHTTNRERFRVTHEYGDCTVAVTAKERELFSKAMNLYWQYLANRHRKEFEERLRQTVKAIGKAQKEGKFDSTEVTE